MPATSGRFSSVDSKLTAWRPVGLFITIVASLSGCREPETNPPQPQAVETVKAALNANPVLGDFVVLASNSVRLKTGSSIRISGGDVAARGTGSGPFLTPGFVVDLQTGASIQPAENLIAHSVRLGTGVRVGDVQTNSLTVGTGATHGNVSGLVPLPSLPTAAPVTVGTSNLTVATGATVTASPAASPTSASAPARR